MNKIETAKKWNSKHTKSIAFRFNRESDGDVIEKLQSVGNKTDYVRSLVRKDMKK